MAIFRAFITIRQEETTATFVFATAASSRSTNPNGINTFALGINSSRTVVGDYFDVAENVSHGFLLSQNVFTQFDFGGLGSTNILGINDAGDFVGDFYSDTDGSGFATIG